MYAIQQNRNWFNSIKDGCQDKMFWKFGMTLQLWQIPIECKLLRQADDFAILIAGIETIVGIKAEYLWGLTVEYGIFSRAVMRAKKWPPGH